MKRKIIAGLMATTFLVTMVFAAFPMRVSAYTGDPIYVGIIGPKGWIQWDGIWEGAQLARDLINDAGGLKDSDGKTHELKLVDIDEHVGPRPSPWDGATELLAALDTYPTMQLLLGGCVDECVFPMREAAMDYAAVHKRPIWIICGASSDELIDDGPDKDNPYDDVREDYERYKYMFRASSFNTTTYLNTLVAFLRDHVLPQKLVPMYGSPVKTYIIAEDRFWCDGIVEGLQGGALEPQAEIVGVGQPSLYETDFGPFLDAIEDSGAKLIIHIFSTVAGPYFIWKWEERKVPGVPVGINFRSGERLVYPMENGWKCEYETTLCVGARTNINPDAEPLNTIEFWDEYEARYGHAPIYTAWGVYIELMHLNKTAADWIGKSCDEMVPIFEETEFDTLLGHFKYTDYHDVYCDPFSLTPIWPPAGWPGTLKASIGTVRPLVVQWQADRREVIWPRGYYPAPGSESPPPLWDPTPLPFARKWKIPPWMYSLGETDFAGGPPIPSPPMSVDDTPAGFFGYFPLPDGEVGTEDIGTVTQFWQDTVPWVVLEADMDGNNFINIVDIARVARDWGKTATPQDP